MKAPPSHPSRRKPLTRPGRGGKRGAVGILLNLFVLAAAIGIAACRPGIGDPPRAVAKNGRIDLAAIDFAGGKTAYLRGAWKFAWKQDDRAFADPKFDDSKWGTLDVPGYWNGLTGTGKGYGWYRIKIKVDGNRLRVSGERLGLSVPLIQSACEVYVNGSRLMSSGTFGTDAASSVPQIHARIGDFDPPAAGEELVIAVRNSNYAHRAGGPYSVPEFGLHAVLAERRWYNDVVRLVALGIIMMMGIYHAMLWFGRREDRASIYFSLGCLVVLLRLVATNGYLERLFPGFGMYELHFKIVYASIPLGWTAFAFFFRELYPEEFSGRIFTVAALLGGVFTAATLVLPCRIYSVFSIVYEGTLFVIGVWFLAGIIMAAKRKRPGALYILPGFMAFFVTGVNDILAVKLIIPTPEVAPVGLVIMIFFQSAVLPRLTAQAFRTSEHLSRNLALEVDRKTLQLQEQMGQALKARQDAEDSRAELHQTYEQLNAVYTILKNDLAVAKSIQETLFPTDAGRIRGLRYSARYIPLIEVGGDIYDICTVGDQTVRLFVSDATGHGIHASLTTMLIKGEYDMLKFSCSTPLEIIEELNDKFFRHYRQIARYFTSFLADIHTDRKKITYVSSGHPSQYLIRGGAIIELATTGRAIGVTGDTNCTMREADFLAGDRLFFFTDGLYEQFNSRRALFGEEPIKKIIRENIGRPISEIMDEIITAITAHTGNDLNDDIIMIGVEQDGDAVSPG
ncbi:MAG TPA: SpoIIE family protein phosphatase [Spirochaetota bacterium]|nr:SpoIIE family protein phosphatase [Spirochaetota bacterium]HQF10434.1 SpoIIE family protein phosphatase [Spirochaetota bacterium]HQH99333.1 SpoIIE family protein phosphatase [Spirochaetota bacterium]HQJ73241.1 SpoIIE family protein phosphatase [Spirochaetota bacterium]